MSPAQGETSAWFEERMGRWVLLQKRPKDSWKREDDRKGVCGLVSRLCILRNAAAKTQVMLTERLMNNCMWHLFFSPLILALMEGRQTGRKQAVLKS